MSGREANVVYPESLRRLLEELERLPGVGARTAERLAFFILTDDGPDALRLADAIRDVKRNIRPCARCGMVTEEDLCRICQDPGRDAAVVCVVEEPKDLYAIERLGTFRGVYHVLMGSLALLEGVEARHLRLDALLERAQAGGLREVILATSPTVEGDTTALHVIEGLRGAKGVKITRLARGIAAGMGLTYASRAMLEDALAERKAAD